MTAAAAAAAASDVAPAPELVVVCVLVCQGIIGGINRLLPATQCVSGSGLFRRNGPVLWRDVRVCRGGLK